MSGEKANQYAFLYSIYLILYDAYLALNNFDTNLGIE